MFQHNMSLQNTLTSENTFDIADVLLQAYKKYPNSPRIKAGLLVHLSSLTTVKQYHTIDACLYLKYLMTKAKENLLKMTVGCQGHFCLYKCTFLQGAAHRIMPK